MLRALPLKPVVSFACFLLLAEVQVRADAAVGFANHMERGDVDSLGECVEFLKFCACTAKRDEPTSDYVGWHKYDLYIYYYWRLLITLR